MSAQFVRCDLTNPAVERAQGIEADPATPAEVSALLRRSCMDCHSDETHWPSYSAVAPLSWAIWYDVDRARRYLNLSRWGAYRPERALVWVRSVCDAVTTRRMPLGRYLWAHPGASLSNDETRQLCDWAASTEELLAARTGKPRD